MSNNLVFQLLYTLIIVINVKVFCVKTFNNLVEMEKLKLNITTVPGIYLYGCLRQKGEV